LIPLLSQCNEGEYIALDKLSGYTEEMQRIGAQAYERDGTLPTFSEETEYIQAVSKSARPRLAKK